MLPVLRRDINSIDGTHKFMRMLRSSSMEFYLTLHFVSWLFITVQNQVI